MSSALHLFFSAALVSVLALVLSPVITAAADQPVGTFMGSIPIPDGVAQKDAREIAIYSLVARRWELKEKLADRAVGYLNHRGHEATLTFVIGTGEITIYCEGYKVNRSGVRKGPEIPHGWINNLKNDVTKRLAMKAATL